MWWDRIQAIFLNLLYFNLSESRIQTQFVYYRMDPFCKLAHSGKWLIVWQEPLESGGDWIHEFFLKPADIFLIPAPFSIGQSSIKSPWQWKFKWNFLSSGLFIYCPPISLRILGKPKQWAMGTKKIKEPFQPFNTHETYLKKYSTKEDYSLEFAEAKCKQKIAKLSK